MTRSWHKPRDRCLRRLGLPPSEQISISLHQGADHSCLAAVRKTASAPPSSAQGLCQQAAFLVGTSYLMSFWDLVSHKYNASGAGSHDLWETMLLSFYCFLFLKLIFKWPHSDEFHYTTSIHITGVFKRWISLPPDPVKAGIQEHHRALQTPRVPEMIPVPSWAPTRWGLEKEGLGTFQFPLSTGQFWSVLLGLVHFYTRYLQTKDSMVKKKGV